MHVLRPDIRLQLGVLGAMLVAGGLALMFERLRTEGPIRLWPLVLIVAGVGRAVAAPWEQRDEGLWLAGTGFWLLAEALSPAVLRTAGPLALATAGLVMVRQSRAVESPSSSGEELHVN